MEQNHDSSSTEIVNGAGISNENSVTVRAQRYSGPLPHPDILARYEEIVPGAAERILSKFEKQTDHRIEIEKMVVITANRKEIGGLLSGFLIAVLTIGGGIYTAVEGKTLLGGSLSFTGLALIVGAFMATKTATRKNTDEK